MGFLDSLFGRNDEQVQDAPRQEPVAERQRPQNADEQALARYRYMLQTAPPEDLEKAHEEAFARLTPEQRQMALQQMSMVIPQSEAGQLTDDPRQLARAATRAEIRQPGSMERIFGGANQIGGNFAGGMGGMLAGSLLTSIAGSFIGSSIAHAFFTNPGHEQGFQASPEAQGVDAGVSDYNAGDFQATGLDSSADPLGDPEGGDFQATGLDSSADPYGDPEGGYQEATFDDGGFDDGGFDGGGFDGGDF